MKDEFMTSKEIAELCKCSRSTANTRKKAVHEETKRRGILILSDTTCLRSIFYEMYVTGSRKKSSVATSNQSFVTDWEGRTA